MADRFPSLDDFSAGQTEIIEINGDGDGNDFLARERAALGNDADQFVTPADHAVMVEDVEDDLLGDSQPQNNTTMSEEFRGFESSFPAIDTQNERVAPGGTITGSGSPFPAAGYSSYKEPEEEPEVVREWRERRDADLSRRAEASQEKKAATVKKAQEDVDDFYVSYGNRADKARAQTRKEAEEFLANREDTAVGGTSWERIAKLIDVSGKGAKGGASGSGKERFRELLLDLRKDQDAPGAGGI